MDLDRALVQGPGGEVPLTTKEVEVLAYLVAHPERTVPRDELLEQVWGYAEATRTRAVDHLIRRLRKKLGDEGKQPRYLLTVHGEGYRLRRPRDTSGVELVGRALELAALDALVEAHRVVWVVGPAGVGKSALTNTWARGCAHVSVPMRSAGSAVAALSKALDVRAPVTVPALADAVDVSGTSLVIFHDAERDPDGVAALSESLPCTVLVTSRVPPPSAGATMTLRGLKSPAAETLFLNRLGSVDPTPDDRSSARTVVDLLAGHPLSILLAASRGEVLSAQQIARHLSEHPLHLLRDPTRSGPPDHAELRGLLQDAWAGLDEARRRTLGALALYNRPILLETLAAVAGPDALDACQALARSGLLQTSPGDAGRLLSVHHAMAVFVREARGPDAAEVHTWLECVRRACLGPRPSWPEVSDLQTAVDLAPTGRTRACLALGLLDEGRPEEARAVLEPPDDPDVQVALGTLHRRAGRLDEALRWFERAGTHVDGDPEWTGQRGELRRLRGDLVTARVDLQSAMAESARRGDATSASLWRARLSSAMRLSGHPVAAEHLLRQALEELPPGTEAHARAAVSLAHGLVVGGRREEARLVASTITPGVLPRPLRAQFLAFEAILAADIGHEDDEARQSRAADRAAARAGLGTLRWRVRMNHVAFLLGMGRAEEAAHELAAAAASERVQQTPGLAAQHLALRGALAHLRGELDAARRDLAMARDQAIQVNGTYGHRINLMLVGVYLELGALDAAAATLADVDRAALPEVHDLMSRWLEEGPSAHVGAVDRVSTRLTVRLMHRWLNASP